MKRFIHRRNAKGQRTHEEMCNLVNNRRNVNESQTAIISPAAMYNGAKNLFRLFEEQSSNIHKVRDIYSSLWEIPLLGINFTALCRDLCWLQLSWLAEKNSNQTGMTQWGQYNWINYDFFSHSRAEIWCCHQKGQIRPTPLHLCGLTWKEAKTYIQLRKRKLYENISNRMPFLSFFFF